MFVSSLTFNYTTVAVSVTFFFDITTKAFKLCYCVIRGDRQTAIGGIIKRKFNSNKGTKTAIDNNMNVCLTTAQSCRYYSMQYEKFILTVTINGRFPHLIKHRFNPLWHQEVDLQSGRLHVRYWGLLSMATRTWTSQTGSLKNETRATTHPNRAWPAVDTAEKWVRILVTCAKISRENQWEWIYFHGIIIMTI